MTQIEEIDLGDGYTLYVDAYVPDDPYRDGWAGMLTREGEEPLIPGIRGDFASREDVIADARRYVEEQVAGG